MRQKVINIQAQTLLAYTGGRAPVSEASIGEHCCWQDCRPRVPRESTSGHGLEVEHQQVKNKNKNKVRNSK